MKNCENGANGSRNGSVRIDGWQQKWGLGKCKNGADGSSVGTKDCCH